MKRYFEGRKIWPKGVTKLHVYLLPHLEEIGELVAACRAQIAQFNREFGEFITPLPDEWLHATVQQIDLRAADVTAAEVSELQRELREQLSRHAGFRMQVGPAIVGMGGVVLDMYPDEEFMALRESTRAAIVSVFGQRAILPGDQRPHISLGYASGEIDSGLLTSRLLLVRPARANLTVSELHLVDVGQDLEAQAFVWQQIASFALPGEIRGPQDGPSGGPDDRHSLQSGWSAPPPLSPTSTGGGAEQPAKSVKKTVTEITEGSDLPSRLPASAGTADESPGRSDDPGTAMHSSLAALPDALWPEDDVSRGELSDLSDLGAPPVQDPGPDNGDGPTPPHPGDRSI